MSSLLHLLLGNANICRLPYGTGAPICLSIIEKENDRLQQLLERNRRQKQMLSVRTLGQICLSKAAGRHGKAVGIERAVKARGRQSD